MKYLVFFSLLAFSVQVVAQDSSTNKNEIGINIFSIMDGRVSETQENNSGYSYEFYPTYVFATGIMYKRNWQKHSLRVSLDYFYDKYDKTDAFWTSGVYETTFRMESRTGYQRTFGTKKIKPFLAIDLLMSAQKRYDLYDGFLVDSPYEHTTYLYNIGLGPAVGVQYQITKWLSVTAEINAEFRGNLIYMNNKMHGNGSYIAFNPIRLVSVNYHF